MLDLSAADARRIALASQGLSAPRPRPVDAAAVRAMVEQLGVVQLDSVNVVARSHTLVPWSRLGAYDPALLEGLTAAAPRAAFEYWAHEASIVPIALWPAFQWRMARAANDAWGRMQKMARRRAFVAKVLAAIAERGPVRASELDVGKKRPAGERGWWAWSETKVAVEWLFWSGQVTAAGRRAFERLYDLPARVIPEEIFAVPALDDAAANRVLVERAARAIGVGTEADLRDHYRLEIAETRAAIADLVEAGRLREARVEGWAKPAYLWADAPAPAPVSEGRAALLSPFDSLIWTRERTERMFGMKVRLEIYTPGHKRIHGYYVLPFLFGESLAARVDLKADRKAKVLRVLASHFEAGCGAPRRAVASALKSELRAMAAWLGLERVEVEPRGDFAKAIGSYK